MKYFLIFFVLIISCAGGGSDIPNLIKPTDKSSLENDSLITKVDSVDYSSSSIDTSQIVQYNDSSFVDTIIISVNIIPVSMSQNQLSSIVDSLVLDTLSHKLVVNFVNDTVLEYVNFDSTIYIGEFVNFKEDLDSLIGVFNEKNIVLNGFTKDSLFIGDLSKNRELNFYISVNGTNSFKLASNVWSICDNLKYYVKDSLIQLNDSLVVSKGNYFYDSVELIVEY